MAPALTDQAARLRAALAGRYEVDREIGRGGMACVYRARDRQHDRDVAIKVVRPELAAPLGPDRFLREIRIAASLQHPHILPLYDSGSAEGILYFVMPYITGESLSQRLQRERQLPVADALRITYEVAGALAYAHARGVIHRDIKPGNILLSGYLPASSSEGWHALVADFGLARALGGGEGDEVSSGGLAVGTPEYMSPEQTSAESSIDGRADIYSLGCVFYAMLAGEPPFTGRTAQVLAARHSLDTPTSIRAIRPTVPVEVESILQTALAKVPADRFPTAQAFAARVDPAHWSPRPAAPRPFSWIKRRTAITTAALALLSGLLWWRLTSHRSARPEESSAVASERLAPTAAAPNHVAVLYFDDETPDSIMRPVANGLTEDLIDLLGEVDALSVISADGVRPYRDHRAPLDSIARALSVGTIVTGSVSGSPERPAVTVRLVDATNSRQLDSRLVESSGGDVLTLRRNLAAEVARFLRQRLGMEIGLRDFRAGTPDGPAWMLMRRVKSLREDARSLWVAGDTVATERTLNAADSLLGIAESAHRGWLEPIVLRGRLAADRVEFNSTAASVARWAPVGLSHAERALTIQPGNPDALDLRGYLRYMRWYYVSSRDTSLLNSAERDLRAAAVPENPSQARAWTTLSALLLSRGAFEEAYVAARRAYESDAFLAEAGSVVFRLHLTSLLGKRWEDAAKWCAEGHQRFPRDWLFTFCSLSLLWMPSGQSADVGSARRLVEQLAGLAPPTEVAVLAPRWRMMLAGVQARAGQRNSALRTLMNARRASRDDAEMDYYEAGTRTLLGERDQALDLLERYLAYDPGATEYLARDPMFESLREDPRMQRLLGRTR
jgi:serine/threonine protein kinase/tetratricopeptide (TPR) repeat protein